MNRVHHSTMARRRMAGLSLIEMMIALVMALIVAAGIISVFTSTSSSNKVQAQMAALQEAGRFAIRSLRTDLANANGAYCSNTGGNAGASAAGVYLDALRAPTIYSTNADAINAAFQDNSLPITLPGTPQAFSVPSFIYMRGYDCTTTACTPIDPNSKVASIPAMGAAVGDRVLGSDVLTIRYLRPGSGWAVSPTGAPPGAVITATAQGVVTAIALNPMTGEESATTFQSGDLAMLADCSMGEVFSVDGSGASLTPAITNTAQPLDVTSGAAPRVFDFSRDFQTVTYYLKVVCVNGAPACPGGPTTGELVRQVDGGLQPGDIQALVGGVERLDFSYGIIAADGSTRYLTANEVDTGVDASGQPLACPPGVSTPGGMPDDPANGCLWRAVQTIQVSILMDGEKPLYTLTPAEMNYTYMPDCVALPASCAATTIIKPAAHAVSPSAQGFPNQLVRREFTTLVALRNFNP